MWCQVKLFFKCSLRWTWEIVTTVHCHWILWITVQLGWLKQLGELRDVESPFIALILKTIIQGSTVDFATSVDSLALVFSKEIAYIGVCICCCCCDVKYVQNTCFEHIVVTFLAMEWDCFDFSQACTSHSARPSRGTGSCNTMRFTAIGIGHMYSIAAWCF